MERIVRTFILYFQNATYPIKTGCRFMFPLEYKDGHPNINEKTQYIHAKNIPNEYYEDVRNISSCPFSNGDWTLHP